MGGEVRQSLRAVVGALAAVAVLALAPAASALPFHDGAGLHVLSAQRLDTRLYALTVKTAALPTPASIRVLVPSGYDPSRRYPVLYLLHGTSGYASDWTTRGDAERTTAGLPLIVVMPDIDLNGDGGGWCTNWPDGRYAWETFHISQLIPWVDANLATVASRSGRAIAGLSQGGFCSMSYASRHPDLFSSALAYSGAPDIYYDPDVRVGAMAIINGTEVGLDHVAPDSMFGNPLTDGINWAAHDPATLANNLRDTKLYMYFGNGLPGPYDSSPSPDAMGIEAGIYRDNIDFHNRLDSLGIPSLYDSYGNGTHAWPYWARDLRWSIGAVANDLTHAAGDPAQFTYTSADDRYAIYGWQVTTHRTAREFSTLARASSSGFALAGSGSATVTTPPVYTPGRYRVTLSGDRVPSQTLILAAGRDRRLTVSVPLGPPNPYQQDTPQADAAGTAVYTTTVSIAR